MFFLFFVGLDGWYQMRCPLSVNGCQFTQQRFISDKKDKIVYNPVTECFSVTSVPGKTYYTVKQCLSNTSETSSYKNPVQKVIDVTLNNKCLPLR